MQTAQGLGRLFSSTGDRTVIDGLGPDGVALGSRALGRLLGRFQSGYMFQYALVMILAAVGFMTWYFYNSVTGGAP